MNKKGMALMQGMLLVLSIVAISFIVGSELDLVSANTEVCVDSDGGKTITIKGDTYIKDVDGTIIGGVKQDSCASEEIVSENYCENNVVYHEGISCGAGNTCQNGACIPKQDEPEEKFTIQEEQEEDLELEDWMTSEEYFSPKPPTENNLEDKPDNNLINGGKEIIGTVSGVASTLRALEGAQEKFEKYSSKLKGVEEKTVEQISNAEKAAADLASKQNAFNEAENYAKTLTPEQVEAAKKTLENTEGSTPEQIAEARKIVDAEKTAKDAKAQLNAADLANEKAQDLAQIAREAQSKIDSAKSQLERAEDVLDAAKESGSREEIRNARKAVREAKRGVTDAEYAATTESVGFLGKYKANFWRKQPFKSAGGNANVGLSTGGYILQTAATAAGAAAIVSYAFKFAGAAERNQKQIDTAAWTSAAIITTWAAAAKILGATAVVPSFAVTGIIVVGATLAWTAITYQDFSQEMFIYSVSVWQPPKGGQMCQECNEFDYGCSEYQCRSMGTACELLNMGTQYEACDWVNENDMNPPIVSQLDILNEGYVYNPEEYPGLPDRGVSIKYVGAEASPEGCIPAFTGLEFGVATDEPAECKIDLERTYSYADMTSYMAEGAVYTYNHTIAIPSSAFPSQYALNGSDWLIETGQEHNFYIRCEDRNGNANPMHFVVNFCVDDGPDTTAPEIETNYLEEAYVRHQVQYVDDVEVYTNEPADCRWDYRDVDYDRMENGMDDCSQSIGAYTYPSRYQYGCHANLTGIVDGERNDFYIRCKDKPGLDESNSRERRIANQQSYVLTLIGTNQLAIDEIFVGENLAFSTSKEVEEIIFKDSTSPIQVGLEVTTSQGADKLGSSRCSYNSIGDSLYYEFYNDGNFDYNYINTHDLYLGSGFYNYNIRCCDLANNCDTELINFEVDIDITEPEIARAYYEEGYMKIVTTESSECAYSTATCNYLFEDALTIETIDNTEHYVGWDTESDLYIKCKDEFGNLPNPDECQIVVRAYEEFVDTDNTK